MILESVEITVKCPCENAYSMRPLLSKSPELQSCCDT